MFDTAKVQRMLPELEQFVRTHSEIYLLVHGGNIQNLFALMKRLQNTPRALLVNSPMPPTPQSILGVPVKGFDECVRNFNPKTGIVILDKKSPPNPLTNIAIGIVGGQQLNIPAFALNDEECMALYDRLTMFRVLQQYNEDGIGILPPIALSQRLSRGMTTFLDPRYQNLKVQFIDTRIRAMPKFDLDDTGIVVQGPIDYNNNCTLQTVLQYRTIYPHVPIVISTWHNEATDQFRTACQKNSIVILENELPSTPGMSHINYQLESSLQGMKYLRKNTAVKFALKTRTDQRFYRHDFLIYFRNMIKAFPPFGNKLKKRILVWGHFHNSLWWAFFVSDQFYFGAIEDMLKLFGISKQTSAETIQYLRHLNHFVKLENIARRYICPIPHPNPRQLMLNPKVRQFYRIWDRLYSCEVYIAKTFYRECIAPIEPDTLLETYWNFVRDYLIFADGNAVLLDWPKYEYNAYEVKHYYHSQGDKLDQPNWLSFYLEEID